MNNSIAVYLKEYIENPNPQYAVLISGHWGCGKTFFIKRWLSERINENDSNHIVRKPIYVSLYGLNCIAAINDAIEREVKPWLYSKGMKIAKKIVKAFGKATLRYDFDIDGDNENGQKEQLSYTLDIMSLINCDEDGIVGEKILVFDDLERCHIDIEELLGYINFFVEHSKCKVIVIGDVTKLGEVNNKFLQHKEKIFGREFSIMPDSDSAITAFIDEVGTNQCNQLGPNFKLIKDIFVLSKINNLRIVRQAIYDYNQCVRKVSSYSNKSQYANIVQTLLCNFVITYLEYKTGNKVYENWKSKHVLSYLKKDEEFDFKHKYNSLQYNIDAFNDDMISCIMDYQLKGSFNESYITSLLKEEKKKQPWEILNEYYQLDNDTFEKNYNLTIDALKGNKIENINDIISSMICILMIDKDGVKKTNKDEITNLLMNSIYYKMDAIKDLDKLYLVQCQINRVICRYSDHKIYSSLEKILSQTQSYYDKRMKRSKSKLALFFESLSDDTVQLLIDLLQESLPDKSRSYGMGAIFTGVNYNRCVNSILRLSNASRVHLLDILGYHYRREVLGLLNAKEFISRYSDDILPMKKISDKLFSRVANYTMVDALTIRNIAEFLKVTSQKIENMLNIKS